MTVEVLCKAEVVVLRPGDQMLFSAVWKVKVLKREKIYNQVQANQMEALIRPGYQYLLCWLNTWFLVLSPVGQRSWVTLWWLKRYLQTKASGLAFSEQKLFSYKSTQPESSSYFDRAAVWLSFAPNACQHELYAGYQPLIQGLNDLWRAWIPLPCTFISGEVGLGIWSHLDRI